MDCVCFMVEKQRGLVLRKGATQAAKCPLATIELVLTLVLLFYYLTKFTKCLKKPLVKASSKGQKENSTPLSYV